MSPQRAPLVGEPPASTGHAIEVRLYAEDPTEDWQPQSGVVRAFSMPRVTDRFTNPTADPGIRLDAGIEAGDTITTFYDPMIAKVIGVGSDRTQASLALAVSLEGMAWDGPKTNVDLLVNVLREADFLAGHTTTAYFAEHPAVFEQTVPASVIRAAAIAAAIASAASVEQGAPAGPAGVVVAEGELSAEDALALAISARHPRPRIGGWRLFHPDYRTRTFALGSQEIAVEYRQRRDRWELSANTTDDGPVIEIVTATPAQVRMSIDGVERRYSVRRSGTSVVVTSPEGSLTLTELPRYTDPSALAAPGSLLAPMPGTVIRIGAEIGDIVEAGQSIIWVEAMKMEHTIRTDAAGVLDELRVAVGDQVDIGMLLAVISGDSEEGVVS